MNRALHTHTPNDEIRKPALLATHTGPKQPLTADIRPCTRNSIVLLSTTYSHSNLGSCDLFKTNSNKEARRSPCCGRGTFLGRDRRQAASKTSPAASPAARRLAPADSRKTRRKRRERDGNKKEEDRDLTKQEGTSTTNTMPPCGLDRQVTADEVGPKMGPLTRRDRHRKSDET